jgi:hypothetical protein
MKSSLTPLLLVPMIFSAEAQEIQWTATGTVTAVSGTGFAGTASVSNPVSVKFSYSLVSDYYPLNGFVGIRDNGEFYGNVGLTTEVTIGANTWKGFLAYSPPPPPSPAPIGVTALLVDAWRSDLTPDIFTVTASSGDPAVFSPFPYTGSSTARSIQIILRDNTAPSDFMALGVLPNASTPVSAITAGSGSISAGGDQISFSITPASVTVAAVLPPIPLKISRTPTGIELRWPSESGVNYRLEECDALTGWQQIGSSYPGTGSEIVVPLTPFAAHPNRRFYHVVRE